MAPATVERTVLWDVVSWIEETPGRPDRPQHHTARIGQTVTMPATEAERLEALVPPAVGTEEEALVAMEALSEPPSWSDEQLDSAAYDDVIAYVGQHPSEAERVIERENTRRSRGGGKPRKTILEAAGRVIQERDAALEEAADRDDLEDLADAEARAAAVAAAGAPTTPRIPA